MAFTKVQGLNLYFEHFNQDERRTLPLVFVHGLACTHEDWKSQVDFFKPNHSVITCDLPGHGFSDPPTDGGSIESLSSALASLLNELDVAPSVLIGHSMGCRVIVQAALDAPDRVAKLILLDGSRIGENDPQEAEQNMRQHIAKVGYTQMMEAFFANTFVEASDPTLKKRVIERAVEFPEAIGSQLFARIVGWDAGKADAAFAQITVPTFVLQSTYINAQRERVSMQPGGVTPWMQFVQSRIPSSEFDTISGVGHFAMLEAPDAVNEKIQRFVDK